MGNIKVLVQGEIPFDYDLVASAVYGVLSQSDYLSVELDIVDEEFIQKVNREERNIDRVTDVLSFPTLDGVRYKTVKKSDFPLDLDEEGRVFLGSIIICANKVVEQAKEFGHSVEREFCYLYCHGLLHLFNYDHIDKKDDLEMRELANRVFSAIKVRR